MFNEKAIVRVIANATDKNIKESAKPNDIFLFKGHHPLLLFYYHTLKLVEMEDIFQGLQGCH